MADVITPNAPTTGQSHHRVVHSQCISTFLRRLATPHFAVINISAQQQIVATQPFPAGNDFVSRKRLYLRGKDFISTNTSREGKPVIGAKIIGSGIVNEFVEAFYGLVPWDDWKAPHYLDSLLISEAAKPVYRLEARTSLPSPS